MIKFNLLKNDIQSINWEIYFYIQFFRKNMTNRKFVIFGQGRTGSFLVRTLLNCHPQIVCQGEIFSRYYLKVFMPKFFLQGITKSFSDKVYGFDLQPNHLTFHQIKGKLFLSYLHDNGWKIIYLKRKNLFHQKISAIIAIQQNKWHYWKNDTKISNFTKIYLDSNEIIKELENKRLDYIKEQEMLESLPYLEITYEDDLSTVAQHQATANKIFTYLNLPSVLVKTNLQKEPYKISEIIANYEQLYDLLSQTQYAAFLEE